jgi:hypothetical protein
VLVGHKWPAGPWLDHPDLTYMLLIFSHLLSALTGPLYVYALKFCMYFLSHKRANCWFCYTIVVFKEEGVCGLWLPGRKYCHVMAVKPISVSVLFTSTVVHAFCCFKWPYRVCILMKNRLSKSQIVPRKVRNLVLKVLNYLKPEVDIGGTLYGVARS